MCRCGGKLSTLRSLHVAIQCGKSSLHTHTNPKIATRMELGPLGLWPGPVRQPAVCACLHRCLQTRASKQAPCCNKMPVIKVSQSSLEELIELVRQRPEIYDTTHPDHKDAVKGANIWASSRALTITNFMKSSSSSSCCIFSSLYHTAAIVLEVWVWLGKSIQHLYTQPKLIPAHLPQGMETGSPHPHMHPHIRRRSLSRMNYMKLSKQDNAHLSGNQGSMVINEGSEDYIIWLSQFCCIRFGITQKKPVHYPNHKTKHENSPQVLTGIQQNIATHLWCINWRQCIHKFQGLHLTQYLCPTVEQEQVLFWIALARQELPLAFDGDLTLRHELVQERIIKASGESGEISASWIPRTESSCNPMVAHEAQIDFIPLATLKKFKDHNIPLYCITVQFPL